MSVSRSHRALAGIADVYALSMMVGAVEALIGALARRPIPVALLLIVPLLLVSGVIWYHRAMSARISFLSPGEVMLGRAGSGPQKEWRNPYGKNRAGLFILAFLTLLFVGNSWDELGRGGVYDVATVLVRFAMLAVLLLGLMAIGAGWRIGALAVGGFHVLNGLGALSAEPQGIPKEVLRGLALYSFAMAIATGVVILLYRPHRDEPSSPPANAVAG